MMMRPGQIKNFYPGGNTALGFYSLFDSSLNSLERLIILKGGPGTGKSTLIRKVGMTMVERGYNIEFLHCSSDNNSLDGVIIPEIGVGVVDGTAPHIIDPKYPGAIDEIVNLGEHWDEQYLREHREEIRELTDSVKEHFNYAYEVLARGKEIKEDWEKLVSSTMDLVQLDQVAEQLAGEIFTTKPGIRHMFASALTPQGIVNLMEELTANCTRRYILQGLPGSGKSTLMQKLAQQAVEKGYYVELYHCAFDPQKIDMMIIPYLQTAVLDGYIPHNIKPKRTGDRVIDMMRFADKATLEKRNKVLLEKEGEFHKILEAGILEIRQAKNLHDQLEKYYMEAMNFEVIDQVQEQVLKKIISMAEEHEKN